jgi:hypothetical protein
MYMTVPMIAKTASRNSRAPLATQSLKETVNVVSVARVTRHAINALMIIVPTTTKANGTATNSSAYPKYLNIFMMVFNQSK